MVAADSGQKIYQNKDFFQEFVLTNEQDPECEKANDKDPFSMPHSNAYLDLNGDCKADIFFQRTHI